MQRLIVAIASVLIVAGLVACSEERLRLAERSPLPPGPALDGGSANGDATSSTARCAPAGAFGAPRRVAELSDPLRNEWVFRVAPDDRTGLLSRQDNEGSKIFAFARSGGDRPWSGLLEVSGAWGAFVGDPSIATIDGETKLLHTEQIEGLSSIRIAGWDGAKNAAVGSDDVVFASTFNDVSPTFVEASGELWFMRDPGTGAFRIHRSVRAAAAFGSPEIDPVLGGAAFDANGAVAFSQDGLTVFFGARTAGSLTDIDIYSARRRGLGEAFEDVARVEALNSEHFDQPVSLSADGCVLYLTSARGVGDAGAGSIDVFVAERAR